MLDIIVKSLYIMLPGVFANMAPVIFRNHFKRLAVPVDFGKKWKGRRILGDHKTYRGFVTGIAMAILVAYIQSYLYNYSYFKSISLIDYSGESPLLIGFLIGFGTLLGDSAKSFVKRRLDIEPSRPFIPFDQIDSALGALLLFSFIYIPPAEIVIALLILSFVLSITITKVSYYFGIRGVKW